MNAAIKPTSVTLACPDPQVLAEFYVAATGWKVIYSGARVSGLSVTAIACAIGAAVTLPFAPLLVDELASAPPDAIAWLVYLGVFPTAIAFTTWTFALKRTSAGRLGSTTYLVPPVVIGLAWLMLNDVPPSLAFLGGALCIGGVIVARSRGRFGIGRQRG